MDSEEKTIGKAIIIMDLGSEGSLLVPRYGEEDYLSVPSLSRARYLLQIKN